MFAAALCIVALIGSVVADDGQWHPELDGSIIGSGAFRWGTDDGQWKPELDGSALGRGDLVWLNRKKRDALAFNPNAYSTPLDEPVVANAKVDHAIQYNTEAARNIIGGGIPLDLPADTPEVAAGKQYHAIAHENQKLATAAPYAARYAAAPYVATPYAAAPAAARYAAAPVAARYAATPYVATPYAAVRYADAATPIHRYAFAPYTYVRSIYPYGIL